MADSPSIHNVRSLSLEDISDPELDTIFGRSYWYKGTGDARRLLGGTELLGVHEGTWIGIMGITASSGSGGLTITPWTPAVSGTAPDECGILVALLEQAKEIAGGQGRKLRGRGLGQALLRRFLYKGASMGYGTSTLMVDARNIPRVMPL